MNYLITRLPHNIISTLKIYSKGLTQVNKLLDIWISWSNFPVRMITYLWFVLKNKNTFVEIIGFTGNLALRQISQNSFHKFNGMTTSVNSISNWLDLPASLLLIMRKLDEMCRVFFKRRQCYLLYPSEDHITSNFRNLLMD